MTIQLRANAYSPKPLPSCFLHCVSGHYGKGLYCWLHQQPKPFTLKNSTFKGLINLFPSFVFLSRITIRTCKQFAWVWPTKISNSHSDKSKLNFSIQDSSVNFCSICPKTLTREVHSIVWKCHHFVPVANISLKYCFWKSF